MRCMFTASFFMIRGNCLGESVGTYQFDSLYAMSQIDTSPVTHRRRKKSCDLEIAAGLSCGLNAHVVKCIF